MTTHFFESHGGGIERVAGHLCRALAGQGHRVTWVASAADAAPDDPTFDATPIGCINPTERLTGLPMPIPGPGGLRQLARAVRGADAVIVHDGLYVTSIAALALARWHAKPVILVQHIAAIPFRSALLRRVMALANALVTRPMLRAADQLVFISASVRDQFGPLRLRRPAMLCFNGVDGTIFRDDGPAMRPPSVPAQARLALFVGRFVEKKGLAVVRALAEAHPEVRFALAGAGPIDPAGWGLANVLCLGPQTPAQLAALYRGADLLLLPSVGEGYPLVIQEAMASGLPVVCAHESALADPKAAAHLWPVAVDLGDVAGTAAAIAPLLARRASPDERAAMAAYARGAYSWPGFAAALAEAAETLAAKRD